MRFALPELELGTVVEEEPEDLDCHSLKNKYQSKYKKISWISKKMFKVIIGIVFNGFNEV